MCRLTYQSFKSNHYAINLDVVTSFMLFSDFNSIFLSMYCYFESVKLLFFFKKKNFINKEIHL